MSDLHDIAERMQMLIEGIIVLITATELTLDDIKTAEHEQSMDHSIGVMLNPTLYRKYLQDGTLHRTEERLTMLRTLIEWYEMEKARAIDKGE